MKSNYKTGSPFPRLNSSDMMDDIRKDIVNFAGYRGKDTYNEVASNTPRAPYVKIKALIKNFHI